MKRSLVLSVLFASGCFAFVTKEEGREIKQQVEDVKGVSAKNEVKAAELAGKRWTRSCVA